MFAPGRSWTNSILSPEATEASLDTIAVLLKSDIRFIRYGQFNHPIIDEQDVCPTDRDTEVVEPESPHLCGQAFWRARQVRHRPKIRSEMDIQN
jgi:hypothetical protein